jgi:hypothetical protein
MISVIWPQNPELTQGGRLGYLSRAPLKVQETLQPSLAEPSALDRHSDRNGAERSGGISVLAALTTLKPAQLYGPTGSDLFNRGANRWLY